MSLFSSTEFWAATFGAVVGGAIAFAGQVLALWEARKQRADDHRARQHALAHSLQFKLQKIHSNLHGIHSHFWQAWTEGKAQMKNAEPWEIVVPLANPPPQVHLTADEMGMLLSLKEDPVFNDLMDLEVLHNSLISVVHVFNTERTALIDQMAAVSDTFSQTGNLVTGAGPGPEWWARRPRMMGVNSLADGILSMGKNGLTLSHKTLQGVHALFTSKLAITYRLAIKPDADTTAPISKAAE